MLDVVEGRSRTCQGWSRRRILRLGTLGALGLSLSDLLRARGADPKRKDTAVIQVYLGGGPSHLDTYDPKPDAPLEFRGEFGSVGTRAPGMRLCEWFPRQARAADKFSLVRSLRHASADHGGGAHWLMTGYAPVDPSPRTNERPSAGSYAAHLLGARRAGLPAYVAIPRAPTFAHASYLGPGDDPFDLDPDAGLRDLEPPEGITLERVDDRRKLLARLDDLRRRVDRGGGARDRFTDDAYAMITGPEARRAFDLDREAPAVRERYGRTPIGRACLLARRLVEAGVSFVTVEDGGWDHHNGLFPACRAKLPPLDAAIAALVEDLHDRGLAERVLVLAWGEFGRTPRVNPRAGRDHWPGAFTALLAGGGLKMGRVVGSTGPRGEGTLDDPLGPEDVLQTLYKVLGIDPRREFENDAGRPLPLLNRGTPIAGLI